MKNQRDNNIMWRILSTANIKGIGKTVTLGCFPFLGTGSLPYPCIVMKMKIRTYVNRSHVRDISNGGEVVSPWVFTLIKIPMYFDINND